MCMSLHRYTVFVILFANGMKVNKVKLTLCLQRRRMGEKRQRAIHLLTSTLD
jgi:hypothetical protein